MIRTTRLIILSAVFFISPSLPSATSGASAVDDKQTTERVNAGAEPTEICFTENRGQWPDSILFRSQAEGTTLWFTRTGPLYQFDRITDSGRETIMVKAGLRDGNPTPTSAGRDLLDYRCNYFIGSDPAGWRTDVPNYREIQLDQVYPGIDLRYYGREGRMEYDFRLAPGADYSRIKIDYSGVENIFLAEDGSLVVTTRFGQFLESAPLVYQEVGGKRQSVTASFRITSPHSFGFELGPELRSDLPTVIDPVLAYGTYLGGSVDDAARDLEVDATGAVYLTGETFSANFPTVDPYQNVLAGYLNVIVSKLSPGGNDLLYSTYLGGTGSDGGHALALHTDGSLFITGSTTSDDFPTHSAYDSDHNGGPADLFVTRLAASGDQLLYSTYLGGSEWDNADGIAVDQSGEAHITGYTSSVDFPTQGALQPVNGGGYDAFVVKLNRFGSGLVYSTYLGGVGSDDGNAITVDDAGVAYVTGRTKSSDFPLVNPIQAGDFGPYHNAFLTKIDSRGELILFSTILAGHHEDYGYGVDLDASGAVYVTGWTLSDDFPTALPYQATRAGERDLFITKIGADGFSLFFSTYLGGSGDDYASGISVDQAGTIHVAGHTGSTDFPLQYPLQTAFQGGSSDAFALRINGTGDQLLYSTYLGGDGPDEASAITTDPANAAYLCGFTGSNNFPVMNPYQASRLPGGADAFLVKLIDEGPVLCCEGRVGDANNSGEDEPTIGDISAIIDAKFITSTCVGVIACVDEADINQSGGAEPTCEDLTIGDVSELIDYLFISGPETFGPLPDCL